MEHYIRTKSVKSSGAVPHQTKPLSYQTSKCVLEHLEANTRFLLVSHCPCLRNQHKTVPLKIQYLKLGGYYEIHINSFEHSFAYDFLNTRYTVRFENVTYHIFTVPVHKHMEMFMRNFFSRGPTPLVKQLQISWPLPIDLKFEFIAKNIKISKEIRRPITVEKIWYIVDPKSYPVENLSLIIDDPEDNIFDKDWSKINNFLRIEMNFPRNRFLRSQKLCNIRNNNVQIHSKNNSITTESLAELAHNWMNTNRKAGTKYTFQFGLSSIGYLQKLSTEITTLTGITARNDVDQLWFSFEMGNAKELMIYREYGPYEKPTCINETIRQLFPNDDNSSNYTTVHWALAMEIL